jgi:hypothetical protein
MSTVADSPHSRTHPSHRAVIQDALDNRRCPRRVRHEVRDGVAVAAFSAASSTVAAIAFGFLLSRVG